VGLPSIVLDWSSSGLADSGKLVFRGKTGLAKIVFTGKIARIYFHKNKIDQFLFVFGMTN